MTSKIKKKLAISIGLVAGVLFIFFGSKELIHSRQLQTHGKAATAEVLAGEDHVSGKLHRHTYYLQVRYPIETGGVGSSRVEVSEAIYQTAAIGSSVRVHYLPEDPAICQVGEAVELRYGTLLWGIVIIFGAVYLLVFFAQPADKKEMVESLDEHAKTLALGEFEYASVDAKKFKHLDLDFYDNGQRHLEASGYRFLDDIENVTLRRRSGVHTFLRRFLRGDQIVMGACYHFVPKFTLRVLGAKPVKVLDLETWFSDGCFVCTSNAEMAGKLDSPPAIDALRLPAATTWDMLLETHQRRIDSYQAKHPGVTPIKLENAADVSRAQAEQQRIKSEFRKRVGLTKAELERIAGTSNPKLDEIHDAYTKRREGGK
jgi:hypothetical protein